MGVRVDEARDHTHVGDRTAGAAKRVQPTGGVPGEFAGCQHTPGIEQHEAGGQPTATRATLAHERA